MGAVVTKLTDEEINNNCADFLNDEVLNSGADEYLIKIALEAHSGYNFCYDFNATRLIFMSNKFKDEFYSLHRYKNKWQLTLHVKDRMAPPMFVDKCVIKLIAIACSYLHEEGNNES